MGFITHGSNSGCVSTWIDPRHLRIPWCSFFFLSFFLTLFLLYYACSNPAFVCVNACYPIQTGFRTSYEFWGEIQRKCSIVGSTTTTKKKEGVPLSSVRLDGQETFDSTMKSFTAMRCILHIEGGTLSNLFLKDPCSLDDTLLFSLNSWIKRIDIWIQNQAWLF